MNPDLQDTTAILSRTPPALKALLSGLPDVLIHGNEGAGTWSAFEVMGHLIHADRTDWIPRARKILEYGEARPFEAFDRQGHQREIQGKSLNDLLSEFAQVRADMLAQLGSLKLTPEDLERRGKHPALGIVTLGQLLATWAVHDLTHLHQISRIVALQYEHAVGPFRDYLGVLKCSGHSSPG